MMTPEEVQGTYERLPHLWSEELRREHPNWDKLDRWNEKRKTVELELAWLEADE